MADSPKPIDEIIGQGADAGPGAQPEAQEPPQPSIAEQAGIPRRRPSVRKSPVCGRTRLKDERAKRQAFQQQVRELEEERNALLQAQYRQQEQPQQPQQSAADDFWAAPKGYVENKLKTLEQNFSFRIAHDRYGDDFEQAYSDMLRLAQGGDPSVVRWVMSTPDPGRAMMLWYGPVAGNRREARPARRSALMPATSELSNASQKRTIALLAVPRAAAATSRNAGARR